MAGSTAGLLGRFVVRLPLRPGGIRRTRLGGSVLVLALVAAAPLWAPAQPLATAAILVTGFAAAVVGFSSVFAVGFATVAVGFALAGASLTATASMFSGLERAVAIAIGRVHGHVTVSEYGLDFTEYREVAHRLATDPRVRAVSPFCYATVGVVRRGDARERAAVLVGKGVDPAAAAGFVGFAAGFGRGDLDGLRPADPGRVPGIVLGRGAAGRLGVTVGDEVSVVVQAEIDGSAAVPPPRHATFEVTDVLGTGAIEIDDGLALVHLTAAQALFFREDRASGLEVQLVDPALAEEVARDFARALGRSFRTSTWRDTHGALLAGLAQVRAALLVVFGLLSVAAASGVATTLALAVRRRRREIAVLRAMGATPARIFWLFEAVGMVAAVPGALVGAALGVLACALLGELRFPLDPTWFPLDHLPLRPTTADALGPAIVGVVLAGAASGPVAAGAAGRSIVAGLAS